MRYYIIAGEASGDLHASKLIKQISNLDSSAVFRGWGGDSMEAEGMTLVKHYRDLAFMGFVEVLANLSTIFKNLSLCKSDILNFKPDVVILVDYPGFNMRIAKFLHKQKITNFYYISPQIWAWRESRVKDIKKYIDRVFVILPFEKAFYKRFDVDVDFVGHPLLDDILHLPEPKNKNWLSEVNPENKPVISLLPGSRKQEIKLMLPLMIEMSESYPDYQFIIGAAPSITKEFYKSIIKNKEISLIFGETRQLLKHSKASLISSGTASLEAALIGTPNIICYKGSVISYWIARMVIKVKFIGLANLIMDKSIVKELIQADFSKEKLSKELDLLLNNSKYRSEMLGNFSLLREKLGGSGASKKAAEIMCETLKNSC